MKDSWLDNFEVNRKADRIKIKIKANDIIRKNWRESTKNPTYITITKEQIPKRLLRGEEKVGENVKFIYYTRKETAFILNTIILRNNRSFLQKKRAKIIEQLYDMGVNGRSLYSKMVLEKDPDGVFVPKTMYLVGDNSTGILYYL
jgi:hypothetical protein